MAHMGYHALRLMLLIFLLFRFLLLFLQFGQFSLLNDIRSTFPLENRNAVANLKKLDEQYSVFFFCLFSYLLRVCRHQFQRGNLKLKYRSFAMLFRISSAQFLFSFQKGKQ